MRLVTAPSLSRRSLVLGGLGVFASSVAGAAPLERHLVSLPNGRDRALWLVPPGGARRAAVMLHGLGEASDPMLAMRAWPELYGLVDADDRLRASAPGRIAGKRRHLDDARLTRLERTLARRAYSPLAWLCPFTENPYRQGDVVIQRLAEALIERYLPRGAELGVRLDDARSLGLVGCSMGGFVGLELFLRAPERFAALGGVQSAFGVGAAERYAKRLAEAVARVGPRHFYWGSSREDPYRDANRALARALRARGLPTRHEEPRGPHDQPWLREVGTIECALWLDRVLE